MDQNNPVVKLCIDGLRAVAQKKEDDAQYYFKEAWKIRKNDLDSCIAAHYIAKHQKNLLKTLSWNLKSLKYAKKIKKEYVEDFYPSLYINIADTYEKLGEKENAKKYYDLAASKVTKTSLGSYRILLLESIKSGQQRTA